MRRHAALLFLALVVPTDALASDWQRLAGRQPVPAGARVGVEAVGAAPFTLDHGALRRRLDAGRPVVRIPAPDGTLKRFQATESPVMAPALQRAHPDLRSFSAVGIDDPTATARFDIGSLGFHASVRSQDGYWYVDPRFVGDRSEYLAYARADLVDRHGEFAEGEIATLGERVSEAARAPGDPVVRRTYRLALASDPSYAAFFGTENVAAAKLALVNRVNQIYNDDLAIRLELAADVSYDPVAAACSEAMLDEIQIALDNIVGPPNYEVGHIVLGSAGGGIASLGVVGLAGLEGRGCTGAPNPVGDGFFVDYVAHELGHQFGGPHTFNGTDETCGSQRSNANAVEPGSGSSIMAYAGICDTDDLQDNSDPYFSQRSITNIQNVVDNAGQGGATVTTTNRPPVVTPAPDAFVPIRTPFRLDGTATDADGDALVYTWEQNDPGTGTALRINTKGNGPLFRQFSDNAFAPTMNVATGTGHVRQFPDAAQVAADNTNAETGSCAANVDCYSEFLPTSARTLNFRLTARDLSPDGGGVSFGDTVVTVAGNAPFAVTGPAASQLAEAATTTVTWNVAGTTAPPFDVSAVRISYSDDGGLTFPTVVAASTPNDGSEVVAVPNPATASGRFMVEAIGGVFFDVSDAVPNPTPTPTPTPSASASASPSPTTATATPSPTQTASYVIPTATATAVATFTATPTFPGVARLGPDLALVRRKLTTDDSGRIKLSLRCRQLTAGTPPPTCNGSVRITYERGGRQRKAAASRFSFGATQVGLVTLRLNRRAAKAARGGVLRGRIVAKVGRRTVSKRVKIKRMR